MKAPIISVIMATYNHAQFVARAMESVLTQQGVDFEFLIADDGSTDETQAVIASISDKRIRFFPNKENRGAAIVTNELIGRAEGEFIALINSDDFWVDTGKLAYQLNVLRENPSVGACFGRATFVDEQGNELVSSEVQWLDVFCSGRRSRGKWLRHFFDRGNCLCHPTVFIRKSCYEELGGYDNRLRQLPDFEMWVRLVKRYDIYVSDKVFVAFRNLQGRNASAPTPENMTRIYNESYFILKNFFDNVSDDLLIDGFGDLLKNKKDGDFEIEKSFLFLSPDRWAAHVYNVIGLEKLYAISGTPSGRRVLKDVYGFDDRNLYYLSGKVGAFDPQKIVDGLPGVPGRVLAAELFKRLSRRTPLLVRPFFQKLIRSLGGM